VVAQEYVPDPLLINGKKFGIRVWALITGDDDPVLVFSISDYLVRWAPLLLRKHSAPPPLPLPPCLPPPPPPPRPPCLRLPRQGANPCALSPTLSPPPAPSGSALDLRLRTLLRTAASQLSCTCAHPTALPPHGPHPALAPRAGHEPLKVYMHRNGLVLFSTEAYSGTEDGAYASEDGGAAPGHVTNYAQNVDGDVWSLAQLKEHLGQEAFRWGCWLAGCAVLAWAELPAGLARAASAALGAPAGALGRPRRPAGCSPAAGRSWGAALPPSSAAMFRARAGTHTGRASLAPAYASPTSAPAPRPPPPAPAGRSLRAWLRPPRSPLQLR
jgi:hypothetical protein